MGHSSLQVSLTYLRGLQVKQLLVEDMPGLWKGFSRNILLVWPNLNAT
jgi:hypothetical protein